MPIPDFQSVFLPLLEFASDGQEHTLQEARERIAERFNLTEEERVELLPSGRQRIFDNRVAWAKTYLQHAGLLTAPRRGCLQISNTGLEILQEKPERITIKFLERFPEFVQFHSPPRMLTLSPNGKEDNSREQETPEEILEAAYQEITDELATELLNRVKGCSPEFFEVLWSNSCSRWAMEALAKKQARRLDRVGMRALMGSPTKIV